MKRDRHLAYLSGGMEYARNQGRGWREGLESWIRDNLGHGVFNPNAESLRYLRRRLGRRNFRSLKRTHPEVYQRVVRSIVVRDSNAVAERATYVVCRWDRSAQRGAGTQGEITLARRFGKPVYLVTRMTFESIPGWVLGCSTRIFPTFSSLKHFLAVTYDQRRNR